MGLNDLQSHFTQNIGNTVESVDLLKLGSQFKNNKQQEFKLIVDAECCLDRLYGGYFPDWICGGQWNKMEQFLRNFASVVTNSNLDLVICFNGALELGRLESDWKSKQEETVKFIEEINRHVTHKRKPPPKIWWVPPTYLRTAVRSTFRSLQIRTMNTLQDHHKEVVRFCQKNNFHGVVADDPEYFVFDIPRYFSAQKLKLTFKGSLETVELNMKKVCGDLNLPNEKFHIFAAFFGNHLLSEMDLATFYAALGIDSASKTSTIEKVAEFARELESTDVDKVIQEISKLVTSSSSNVDGADKETAQQLENIGKCLRYYSDVTVPKSGANGQKEKKSSVKHKPKSSEGENEAKSPQAEAPVTVIGTQEGEIDLGVVGVSGVLPSDDQKLEGDSSKIFADTDLETGSTNPAPAVNGGTEVEQKPNLEKLLYRVNPEIDNVCTTRHKNGLMSPYIYSILKHKEIKLPVIVEDLKDVKELPRTHEHFRPLRQRVYAILFNLHHLHFLAKQRNEKVPPIFIKETYYCPQTKCIKSEMVQAVEVGWGVPTVERLWLGDKEDCKRKRTRAFLTIMKSDRPTVLDSSFVPQQMLVLVCVLRYILSTGEKIFRKAELDAFLAQAFIQEMTDPGIAQDIEVANLTMRGVHLAHMFMEGVEMAVLVNDACGAPIPYMLFSPWLFFNGKVFNYVLEQQNLGWSLPEICGYKMDLVVSIDQLRVAVLEGIKVQYAQSPNPLLPNNGPLMNPPVPQVARMPFLGNQIPTHMGQMSAIGGQRSRFNTPGIPSQNQLGFAYGVAGHPIAGVYSNYAGAQQGRGIPYNDRQRRGVPGRGGQLEVAGMVVGSWGPNYGVGLGNPMVGGGRNAGMALGPGVGVLGANVPINSLFDQMRISTGRGQNYRPAPHNTGWQQRKNPPFGRNQQKKAPFKKESSNGTSKENCDSVKPDKDEPQRLETGSGDSDTLGENITDQQLSSNGPNSATESSPTHVEQIQINNHEG